MDAANPTAESDHELYQALQRAWTKHKDNNDGKVADYIPELSKANPDAFGLAIATTKGKLYAVGDAEVPFTIQSVSKAFAFCLALEIAGSKRVKLPANDDLGRQSKPLQICAFLPATRRLPQLTARLLGARAVR